jgi:dTDP-4-amino-4,6-dideoxygalactose transaminase
MGLISLPTIPSGCTSNHHMFYVLLPDERTRDSVMAGLKQEGIGAVFHYVPLHLSPMGEKFGYSAGDLPITENLAGRLLRLPFYCDLSPKDQQEIVGHVTKFVTGASVRRIAA